MEAIASFLAFTPPVPSTMPLLNHHPLFIHEIILKIFYALAVHEKTGYSDSDAEAEFVSRYSLASAALVCRAFAEPATEVLWNVHFNAKGGSLINLFKRTFSALTPRACVPGYHLEGKDPNVTVYVGDLHI